VRHHRSTAGTGEPSWAAGRSSQRPDHYPDDCSCPRSWHGERNGYEPGRHQPGQLEDDLRLLLESTTREGGTLGQREALSAVWWRPSDLLVSGRWHARSPACIANLEHIARRIQDVHFSAGEEPLFTVDDRLGEGHALFVDELHRPFPFLGSDLEGVMQPVVLLRAASQRFLALTEQDVVAGDGEAGHRR